MSVRWDEEWSLERFGDGIAIYDRNGLLMSCGATIEEAVDGMDGHFDKEMALVMERFIMAGIPKEGIQA